MTDLEELSQLMAQSKAIDGPESAQYIQLLHRYQAVAGKRRPRTMTAVLGERKQALKETCASPPLSLGPRAAPPRCPPACARQAFRGRPARWQLSLPSNVATCTLARFLAR
eukprot:SAG22_NODE_878_length_6715_cov_9.368652_10_plen_111_part_00